VNRVVPDLEALLGWMNLTQDVFRFELVDVTAPIGTWRRLRSPRTSRGRDDDVRRSDGAGQLYTEEIFRKLHAVPAQLGVSQLICLTNFGITDDVHENVDSKQNEDASITIVSTSSILDALSPPDTTIERLVANQAAAYVNPIVPHKGGVKGCPNFYNEKNDIRFIAGRLALCSECRRALRRRKDGAGIVRAVDALLRR
jgi:hypothetical protein